MQTTPELDRVFPLSGGSAERARLRPPQLALLINSTPGNVLGHRAFMRAWAARRAALAAAASARATASPPEQSAATPLTI
jgi:hypothetical protein